MLNILQWLQLGGLQDFSVSPVPLGLFGSYWDLDEVGTKGLGLVLDN